MMISYAQNFEDVTLWRAFKDIGVGRYVDVGAFHPEIDSVTKWFYDQGWSGINLEPVPEMFEILEAARPRDTNVRAAAGAFSGEAEMAVVPDSMGLSSLDISAVENNVSFPHTLMKVPVRPLREVLEPYTGQNIHFLKIDAEGCEEAVLRGMDFTRFRPWVVVVEATEPLSRSRTSDKWRDVLIKNDYQQAYFDGLNEFYLAAERIELAGRLAQPPSVFDQFELAATVRERSAVGVQQRHNAELRENLAGAKGAVGALQHDNAELRESLAAANGAVTALQHENAESRENLAAANEELTITKQALVALQHRFGAAEKQISMLREQHANSIVRLSEDLSELALALRRSRETQAASARQLQQVLNSRSFRWLAPARRLRAMLLPFRQ